MGTATACFSILLTLTALAPCSPAADGWTGFHAGASLGYAQYENDWTDIDFWHSGAYTTTFRADAGLVGVDAGYDRAFGGLVLGAQLAATYSTIDEQTNFAAGEALVTSRITWIGSLRVRGGLALEDTLLYLTAGLAVADLDQRYDYASADPGDDFADAGLRPGLTLGIGLEHRLDGRWSVRGELLSTRFANTALTNRVGYQMNVGDALTAVTLGAAYRF